jgi:uncharacterized SAM-binding protein YcdF (DUF218 family)
MTSSRGPDFEPDFGSRATDKPIEPRLRDRHGRSAHEEVAVGPDATDQTDVDPAAGEPMLAPAAEENSLSGTVDRSPVIPAEILDAQARSADGRGDPTPSDGTGNPLRVGTRWFRIRRRITATCAVAVVLGMLYFLVSLLQVWSTGRTDDAGPVDAIVVMGAAQYDGRPSPQLAARLDHVVEIWPSGVAPLVVVTGGNIPGDRFTEAEASAEYLIERGIPADVILLENTGSTSQESLTSVSEMLAARGLDDVMIVTDPYHALRSRLIAEEVGLDAEVSSTDTSVVTGFDSFTRHVKEAGGVAIGRVIGFDRLSDLVD